MQYLGGKSRLGRRIAEICDVGRADAEPFWDLCCGTCNVVQWASTRGTRHAVDVVPSLMTLLSHVRDGTFEYPPEISRERYAELQTLATADPKCPWDLLAFVGFGLSFGGKWFAGYASNARGDDYPGAATRGLQERAKRLQDVELWTADWRELAATGVVTGTVYIDPPYAGTTGYKAAPPHDLVEFWRSVDALVARPEVRAVYVSEYAAPDHWREVARWEGQKAINRGRRVERLFTRSK